MSEHRFLERLPEAFGPFGGRVLVGIGDDAAVLSPGHDPLVWTVDAAVEGAHFTRALASFEDVGYRSFMAAASDLAAMGARPLAALSALTAPRGEAEAIFDAIVRGQRQAASAVGAPVVGGNVASAPLVSVTTSLLGEARAPILRSGARAGQTLYLAGRVGLAAAGLRLLRRGLPLDGEAARRAAGAFRRPEALVAMGRKLAGRAAAAIDISDGLAQDAGHIARASAVTLRLDAEAILDAAGPDLAEVAALLGVDPLDLALSGGEDYALLVSSSEDLGRQGLARIGEVISGPPVVRVLRFGNEIATPAGFDHLG